MVTKSRGFLGQEATRGGIQHHEFTDTSSCQSGLKPWPLEAASKPFGGLRLRTAEPSHFWNRVIQVHGQPVPNPIVLILGNSGPGWGRNLHPQPGEEEGLDVASLGGS